MWATCSSTQTRTHTHRQRGGGAERQSGRAGYVISESLISAHRPLFVVPVTAPTITQLHTGTLLLCIQPMYATHARFTVLMDGAVAVSVIVVYMCAGYTQVCVVGTHATGVTFV